MSRAGRLFDLCLKCGCAVALLAIISPPGLAQQPPQRPPAARTTKSRLSVASKLPPLALNNQLTVPPAYDATRAYFPIEGDRLVAYDYETGEQAWTASIKAEWEPTTGDGLLF